MIHGLCSPVVVVTEAVSRPQKETDSTREQLLFERTFVAQRKIPSDHWCPLPGHSDQGVGSDSGLLGSDAPPCPLTSGGPEEDLPDEECVHGHLSSGLVCSITCPPLLLCSSLISDYRSPNGRRLKCRSRRAAYWKQHLRAAAAVLLFRRRLCSTMKQHGGKLEPIRVM